MEHTEYLEAFRQALATRSLKFTRQRQAIVEVLFLGQKHMTLDDILKEAKGLHPSVGYATVYRTMKLLVSCGMVDEHKFPDGQARYERMSSHHHDHMICLVCGKIIEFEDDAIEKRQHELAEELGFLLVDHRHEIYVKCQNPPCSKR